jgi:hypothetical protein
MPQCALLATAVRWAPRLPRIVRLEHMRLILARAPVLHAQHHTIVQEQQPTLLATRALQGTTALPPHRPPISMHVLQEPSPIKLHSVLWNSALHAHQALTVDLLASLPHQIYATQASTVWQDHRLQQASQVNALQDIFVQEAHQLHRAALLGVSVPMLDSMLLMVTVVLGTCALVVQPHQLQQTGLQDHSVHSGGIAS